ncbi:MAG TPA: twin-arginine translocation signal domain-containing protein, partial [Gemmatimonadales bacterium]|nr:twin-arginine translocation signal domain-containing protein [Gemmatimonadales bacterium]
MKISRRQFLAGVGAAGAAVGVDAFGLEAHRVLLSRHEVRIPGLPSGLDGLRMAQVSDVHFPGNRLAARAALDLIHQERPDIVLLTGDMTESVRAMGDVRSF